MRLGPSESSRDGKDPPGTGLPLIRLGSPISMGARENCMKDAGCLRASSTGNALLACVDKGYCTFLVSGAQLGRGEGGTASLPPMPSVLMPPTSTSGSVFGLFKKQSQQALQQQYQTQEEQLQDFLQSRRQQEQLNGREIHIDGDALTSPPGSAPPWSDLRSLSSNVPSDTNEPAVKDRSLQSHKREGSLQSVTSSVSNLRRSVSLRSPRSQSNISKSLGHRHRNPSISNLLNATSSANPIASSSLPEYPSSPGSPSSPSPRKIRSKLSLTRPPLFRAFRSSDNLLETNPLNASTRLGSIPADPPFLSIFDPVKNASSSMLATAPTFKRRDSDRQGPHTATFRDTSSTSAYGGASTLSSGGAMSGMNAGGQQPQVVYQQIQETAAKRMATIEYLKRVHEGDIYYFGTLHYTSAGLAQLPSLGAHRLGRRATGYLMLGYSLPIVMELNSGSPLEYLRALSALMQEFETYQGLVGYDSGGISLGRGRMGQMFKTGSFALTKAAGKTRRSSTANESLAFDANATTPSLHASSVSSATSPQDTLITPVAHDFQYLLTPHLPFDPEFGTTFATLCSTLVETYANLLSLVTGPEVCSIAVGEQFAKGDKAIRKVLVSNVMREFEDHTRAGMKTEVAGVGRLVLGGLM